MAGFNAQVERIWKPQEPYKPQEPPPSPEVLAVVTCSGSVNDVSILSYQFI